MEPLHFAPTPTCWHPTSFLAHRNPLPRLCTVCCLGLQHNSPWWRMCSPKHPILHSPPTWEVAVSGSPLFPEGLTFPRTYSVKTPSAESGALAWKKTDSVLCLSGIETAGGLGIFPTTEARENHKCVRLSTLLSVEPHPLCRELGLFAV